MKCWFCEADARGVCIVSGRAVCHEHGYKLNEFTHAKSDTGTGFSSFLKGFNVLKCKDCKIEWESWEQGKKILK